MVPDPLSSTMGRARFIVPTCCSRGALENWRSIVQPVNIWPLAASRVFNQELAYFSIRSRAGDLVVCCATHQRLVIHCLSEVGRKESTFKDLRAKLEQQLAQCLLFECDFTNDSSILKWHLQPRTKELVFYPRHFQILPKTMPDWRQEYLAGIRDAETQQSVDRELIAACQ
ncbi:hypothetical protein N657DRAFT_670669 [Parathielavia appendiculata]|uniref:Uncharacterized protein n=1 Tax=Parathielavia appendiculata TaxID=2587402 RepID=A0AAN6U1Q7_9PEZI|nr:hypothetical protein N657DRAFT_670669 [Parathielavia appendiculata]